jgi:hypothetical protein
MLGWFRSGQALDGIIIGKAGFRVRNGQLAAFLAIHAGWMRMTGQYGAGLR